MVTFATVRRLALALPETEESVLYGTPAFKVAGRLYARLRDDGALVVKVDPGHRDALMDIWPDVYYITPHYQDYPYVLVRLAAAEEAEMSDLLADAWALTAPKRLAAR
ncbi:MAG TPA: MmcQ/YjbR family DNA-binding protein [Thermomicrobiales bacterium]|nr:MmcQ/YjbR family DNA-binding protein [Thermomicrobiales bacterium]